MARKKSDKRLRTVVAYSRMTPEEYAEVQDKAAASDQDLFDVGASLGGLQAAALVAIIRTDEADLASE